MTVNAGGTFSVSSNATVATPNGLTINATGPQQAQINGNLNINSGTLTFNVPAATSMPAGLSIWLDASHVNGARVANPASGTQIGTWTDLSGLAHNATQGNAGNQPTLISNGINGQPTIRFNGSSWINETTYSQADPSRSWPSPT